MKNVQSQRITFNQNKEIVSRPFEKFFNLGENQFTQHKDLDFVDAEFYDKLDGSMITSVIAGNKVTFKTKKSFYSDVAVSCQKDFGDNDHYNWFCVDLAESNYTPIFEYMAPSNRIVIDYGSEPKLTLLAIRDNATGEYIDRDDVVRLAHGYKIPLVKKYNKDTTITDILKNIENDDSANLEGYVCVLKSGQRVKMKFPAYLLKHKTLERINEKNIAEMVLEECIDDFKVIVDPKFIPIIETIEHKVFGDLLQIKAIVTQLISYEWVGKSLRDIGMNYSNHPQFNPAIQAYKGKNLDDCVKSYFMAQYLPNYSSIQLW